MIVVVLLSPGGELIDISEIVTGHLCSVTAEIDRGQEELKSLLMKAKEESERAGLRLNIKKKLKSCIWPLCA